MRKIVLSALLIFGVSQGLRAQGTLDEWLHYEQHAIDRTVDKAKIQLPDVHEQNLRYRPETAQTFDLPSAWVPAEELKVVISLEDIPEALREDLFRKIDGRLHYRLFVHPESGKFYEPLTRKFPLQVEHEASSTASSRTVLVRHKQKRERPYFVKLSLDVKLGGVRRTIPSGEAARSIGVQKFIKAHPDMLGTFQIIPEVLGMSPVGWDRGAQIIRLAPEAVLEGRSKLVPMFALYAESAGSKTTLVERLAAQAEVPLVEFVKGNILKPFAQAWVSWAVDYNTVMEAHAQNFLMELDLNDRATGRFFHRDFGGFNVHISAAEAKALELPVFSSFEIDYHQRFADQAVLQSLETYFSGGTLYNFERLLKARDASYKEGSLSRAFYTFLQEEMWRKLGSKKRKPPINELKDSLPRLVDQARALKAKRVGDCSKSMISLTKSDSR